ncbi:MAG: DMT family transporter [Rhodobacteraceae bacterium]|nr:DMT family transporter [Paracoccaceae bacterium]
MENLRGIALMVAAMAGFAVEDMFVKRVSESLPVGQILVILGAGGAVAFALMAWARGQRLASRALLTRPVLLRNLGEVTGTLGYVMAIALTPLSSAAAILQATPLAVTLGAALFMGAQVGWRRWSAIGVGLFGVLLIIRPGLEGFQPASLFALLGVAGLALRDLATRATPRSVGSLQLSAYGFATLVPLGALMLLLGPAPAPIDGPTAARLGGALVMGVAGYYAIVEAMRLGEVAVVTPFRYSRLIFALVIGILAFGEQPDALTLTGAAIIIASGLYTLARERALSMRRARR